jgi:hypothetical protein
MNLKLCLMMSLVAAGCGGKAATDDDFSSLAGLDEKSDSFSKHLKLMGTLDFDKAATVKYSSSPYYRGYQLSGDEGDVVEIWVRSKNGDPVTWLVDGSYRVVAKNDDADANTTDSHITATLHAGIAYKVLFRDYAWESHYFTVSVARKAPPPPPACQIVFKAPADTDLDSLLRGAGGNYDYHELPAPLCADLSTAAAQAAAVAYVRAAGWFGADPSTIQVGAWADGNGDFVLQLGRARDYLDNNAAAFTSNPDDQALFARRDAVFNAETGATATQKEIVLRTDADECSEVAVILVDTRGHTVRVIHQSPLC